MSFIVCQCFIVIGHEFLCTLLSYKGALVNGSTKFGSQKILPDLKISGEKKTKQFISELTKERAVEFYLICMF